MGCCDKKTPDLWIGGNVIVDVVKRVDCYPEQGMLANIVAPPTQSVGGCVTNTIIDLAKMNPDFGLGAIGLVGNDAYGDYVVGEMDRHGINTERVLRTDDAPTSFTDVMSVQGGERTFFQARGANALFDPKYIDLSTLKGKLLHMGYIMLLDGFDADDAEYGTVMARFLKQVQDLGIKTSIDAVSDSMGNFRTKIPPALAYCNYAIINEIECCAVWELDPYNEDGSLNEGNIRLAMEKMAACGVKDKIVVHCKPAGFCLDVPTGTFTRVNSLKLDPARIAGSVGAGDAFCAGCLYSIMQGYSDEDMLSYASAAAAASLFAENSVDGMLPADQVWELAKTCPRV